MKSVECSGHAKYCITASLGQHQNLLFKKNSAKGKRWIVGRGGAGAEQGGWAVAVHLTFFFYKGLIRVLVYSQ